MAHYRGTKCEYNGIKFDSIPEKKYYIKLVNDKVEELLVHPKFIILDGFRNKSGRKIQSITFSPDFMYSIDEQVFIDDVKPINKRLIDESWKLKWKLLQNMYRDENVKFRLIAWDKKVNEFVEI